MQHTLLTAATHDDGEGLLRYAGSYLKRSEKATAPVMSVVTSFNRLALCVTLSILGQPSTPLAETIARAWVEVGHVSLALADYATLIAITSALNDGSIYRLRLDLGDRFRPLASITSSSRSFHTLRRRMRALPRDDQDTADHRDEGEAEREETRETDEVVVARMIRLRHRLAACCLCPLCTTIPTPDPLPLTTLSPPGSCLPLMELPGELVITILNLLPADDLLSVSSTSTWLYGFVDHSVFPHGVTNMLADLGFGPHLCHAASSAVRSCLLQGAPRLWALHAACWQTFGSLPYLGISLTDIVFCLEGGSVPNHPNETPQSFASRINANLCARLISRPSLLSSSSPTTPSSSTPSSCLSLQHRTRALESLLATTPISLPTTDIDQAKWTRSLAVSPRHNNHNN